MNQVLLGLKEVQMGAHDFEYNKVHLFVRKPGNMNNSISVFEQKEVPCYIQSHGHPSEPL